jgi:6-pyruvoyltetrahydropterin/6-carboxytetrahydropterin synthase
MVVEISKTWKFAAAHRLPHHDGKCASLHGHTYSVTVCISGEREDKGGGPRKGMVMDYGYMDQLCELTLKPLMDHRLLNEWIENPTAENLAVYFFERFDQGWQWDIKLVSVTVSESEETSATVRH